MRLARALLRLLGRRSPITTGRLRVPGPRGRVTIRRDDAGVAYVEADRDEDAWYAIGFCHGQDRAFQLELLLRVVRGTLAEVVGPEALPVDRLSRRIGFRRLAAAQRPALDDDVRRQIDAYARGCADGATVGCRRRAHERVLLGIRPTPWEPDDVLATGQFLAFALGTNWDAELLRLRLLVHDGPEALAALDLAFPAWLPVAAPPSPPAEPAVERLASDLALLRGVAGVAAGAVGSNAWALAPSRTATGRPILAADPHLNPVLPSYWYLAHVRTPEWAASGATFVSQPMFPLGHNDVAAWGATVAHMDNTDLFCEAIGRDGRSVREGDRYVRCEARREMIRAKGAPDVVEEVLVTPRGPIVSPALGDDAGARSIMDQRLASQRPTSITQRRLAIAIA